MAFFEHNFSLDFNVYIDAEFCSCYDDMFIHIRYPNISQYDVQRYPARPESLISKKDWIEQPIARHCDHNNIAVAILEGLSSVVNGH